MNKEVTEKLQEDIERKLQRPLSSTEKYILRTAYQKGTETMVEVEGEKK